ncbi:MAG: DUF1566 domain-containing protein [Rudaea sp.]|nr:DUF1566 domain-containing protein [Rudaea sp.]
MSKFTKLLPVPEQWVMVRDEGTGLVWTADNVSPERLTFADAKKAIVAMNAARFGGYDDWRLPTITELLTLVDYTRHNPAIDTDVFRNAKPNWYWSSSPGASSPADYAWGVGFGNGFSGYDHRSNDAFVRAVRSVSPASAGQ